MGEDLEELLLTKMLADPGGARKRIAIVSIGTRGDVQPFVVLGLSLQSRGHNVVMATEDRLRPLVDEMGLPWRRIEGDETGIIEQPHVQKMLADGQLFKMMKVVAAWKKQFDELAISRSFITALEGADIVVTGGLCLTRALCVAEKMGAGFVCLAPGPTVPTSEFPIWALPVPCACLNRWTYNFLFKLLWGQEKKHINEFRTRDLQLAPMRSGPLSIFEQYHFPMIVAASELTCGPKMVVPSDYPSYAVVGGFIFPPEGTFNLEPQLAEFMGGSTDDLSAAPTSSDGRPVVYLGWGSMPAPDPVRMVRLARELCEAANCRAVLVAGWSGLLDPLNTDCAAAVAQAAEGGTVLVVKSTPHDWLLPRCAALVHHCGIGTCGAAIRAGRPQIACPVMVDQPHNAKMLKRLGVASGIVPYAKLSVTKLLPPLLTILRERGNGPLCTAARHAADRVHKESARTLDRYADLVEQAHCFPKPTAVVV